MKSRRILIVKLSALGDVLRTTSLLRPLARRHPQARISWLTSKAALPLLETNPWISELATSEEGLSPGPGFDLVLSLEEDASAARLASAVCRGELVGVTVGGGGLSYTPSSAPYYDLSLLHRDADGGHAAADRLKAANKLTYAELWLKVLGLPKPAKKDGLRPVLVLSAEDRASAAAFARKAGLADGPAAIGLNPGAGSRWPAKQVPVEAAVCLARALVRRFRRPVILFGGKDEAARNRAIARGVAAAGAVASGAPVLDPGTGHLLRSFAGFVDLCEAVVTTDTLALHIAAALGKKTFALVGPTSASELDVFGQGEIVVPAGGCSCFYRPRCLRGRSCLDRMPASRVVDAVARWVK
ncbi:MAG: glycosyltransferase family 9 protein [Elusimicrobia bacterium]|nr:glycosyltransferase family 9 protein [Elusimicrobiota bacterium]